MPLPLAHTAIGLTTAAVCESEGENEDRTARLLRLAVVALLANLPDIDMLPGLLAAGDGHLFHRGPTHSLFFALAAGFAASRAWRIWPLAPRISWTAASLVVFSHVAADLLLTAGPVSLFWPLELYGTLGVRSWGGIWEAVCFHGARDAGIAAVAIGVGCLLKRIRRAASTPAAADTASGRRT